jgi:hypothetical protein
VIGSESVSPLVSTVAGFGQQVVNLLGSYGALLPTAQEEKSIESKCSSLHSCFYFWTPLNTYESGIDNSNSCILPYSVGSESS